jgi:hypothetical protein
MGFELRASYLQSMISHTSSPFCSGYFGDGGLWNYLPGLASNHDPPDLTSQVCRIIGVSHWHLALINLKKAYGIIILFLEGKCWGSNPELCVC